MQSVRDVLRQSADIDTANLRIVMQSVRDVLRQRTAYLRGDAQRLDAIRAGCAEAKTTTFIIRRKLGWMQSVRDVLRQRWGR